MKPLKGLRPFQEKSVEAVLEGLEGENGVFALADEVGLGKTRIAAEVAFRTIIRQKKSQSRKLIFYVAPSLELLDQNLKSMKEYLDERYGDQYTIKPHSTRLTCLPLEIQDEDDEARSRTIHLIGLSSETSFNHRTPGLFSERAFMACLFGAYKRKEFKTSCLDFFYCMGKPFDSRGEEFTRLVEKYRKECDLSEFDAFRDSSGYNIVEGMISEHLDLNRAATRAQKASVRAIRVELARYILNDFRPQFVIFDEWHKYKRTCFENELLKSFLDNSRKSRSTKVLLVSATPLAVEFKDERNRLDRPGNEDMKGLLQMYWGEQNFSVPFTQLVACQHAYIDAVYAFAKTGDPLSSQIEKKRRDYETLLRGYCVRTERPKVNRGDEPRFDQYEWEEILAPEGSLDGFLTQFRDASDVRTPITSMWLDGHHFPRWDYSGLKKIKVDGKTRVIPGLHWKVDVLGKILEADYTFPRDNLHSSKRPPLWLFPGEKTQNRKQLIFTDYRFIPDEICKEISGGKLRFGKVLRGKSDSDLGYFPFEARKAISHGESLAHNFHFLMFHPFVCYENQNLNADLDRMRPRIRSLLESEGSLLDVMHRIDSLLTPASQASRLDLRKSLFGIKRGSRREPVAISKGSRAYLRYLFIDGKYRNSIGYLISSGLSAVIRSFGEKEMKEEKALLDIASSMMRLFACPEAQALRRFGRKKTDFPAYWNAQLRFALWYAKRYQLAETLQGYCLLIQGGAPSTVAILEEIHGAISLRKSPGGNRYIRSFHDRKMEGERAEDKTSVSQKSMRSAFNSPFPPYVLVSTSVGQEGLDFHRYCSSIIHWSPPIGPATLRQREGRLDRFGSLQVRIAVEGLQAHERKVAQSADGMSPDFVVMIDGKRRNRIQRRVLFLPFTSQAAAWRRCLERMHYSDLLLGAPDPIADEKLVLSAFAHLSEEEQRLRLEELGNYAINLSP